MDRTFHNCLLCNRLGTRNLLVCNGPRVFSRCILFDRCFLAAPDLGLADVRFESVSTMNKFLQALGFLILLFPLWGIVAAILILQAAKR